MAKSKSKLKFRKKEEYLACEECGTLIPKESMKSTIFGSSDECPNCGEDGALVDLGETKEE